MDEMLAELLQGEMFHPEYVSVPRKSAFTPYTSFPGTSALVEEENNGGGVGKNVNKRMILLLRRIRNCEARAPEPERERCYRHMLNERLRRGKQKQSYLDLHSLLPNGTKNDKNSIVQTATQRIQELQKAREELEGRIREMEGNLEAMGRRKRQAETKIRLKVPYPTSGIDSMIEILKCLKALGSKTKTTVASFSPQEFSATLDIDTEMEHDKVEKMLQRKLDEAEWTLLLCDTTTA